MLERDPKKLALRLDGRGMLPVTHNGLLHPLKVDGIVDVTHFVDIGR